MIRLVRKQKNFNLILIKKRKESFERVQRADGINRNKIEGCGQCYFQDRSVRKKKNSFEKNSYTSDVKDYMDTNLEILEKVRDEIKKDKELNVLKIKNQIQAI